MVKDVLNKSIGKVTVQEFRFYVGRVPRNQEEMDEFSRYWFKGMNEQINFDVVGNEAAASIRENIN